MNTTEYIFKKIFFECKAINQLPRFARVMKIAIRSGKCFGVAGMREKCFAL